MGKRERERDEENEKLNAGYTRRIARKPFRQDFFTGWMSQAAKISRASKSHVFSSRGAWTQFRKSGDSKDRDADSCVELPVRQH